MKQILAASFALLLLAAFAGLAPAGQSKLDPQIPAVFRALEAIGQDDSLAVAQAQTDPGVPGNLLIEPGEEGPVKFDEKLALPGTPMDGKSLEELIVGSPVFPPIEGLEDSIWKGKNCGTCHQWTKERLCVQAKTYIGAEQMVGRLEHPYGLPFKQLLERWAEGGCQ